MSVQMYKGVHLLSKIDSTYVIWATEVEGFMRRNHKLALEAILKVPTANVAVVAGDGNVADVFVDVASPDLEAASVLLLFMCTEMKHMYFHLKSGRDMWTQLRSDFDAYASAHAPVLAKKLRSIRPEPGETSAAYIARAQAMGRQLVAIGRKEDDATIRDLLWEGMEAERPAWETTIESMRVVMANASLNEISAAVSRYEVTKLGDLA